MSKGTLGVVGAGTMGQGITQVLSSSGREVLLYDVAEAQLADAEKAIAKALLRQVEKGKLNDAERTAAIARLRRTTTMDELGNCEIIIEAAPEQPALKEKLF